MVKECPTSNGGCDPDIVSGSLPYLVCIFTKLYSGGFSASTGSPDKLVVHIFLIWRGSCSTLRDLYVCMELDAPFSPMGFMGSWCYLLM